jgi:hypothetical protein
MVMELHLTMVGVQEVLPQEMNLLAVVEMETKVGMEANLQQQIMVGQAAIPPVTMEVHLLAEKEVVVPVAVGMREAEVKVGMAPQAMEADLLMMEVAVEAVEMEEALLGTVMAMDPPAMAPALEAEVKVEEMVVPLAMNPLEREETEMTLAPDL